MINVITSKDNKIIKEIKQLAQKKFRDELGSFLIEGQTLISEALDNGALIKFIIYCEALSPLRHVTSNEDDKQLLSRLEPLLNRLEKSGVPIFRVDERLFIPLSDTITPQGILGVVSKREITAENFFAENKEGNLIVLDRLQDPGNLGSILRTADAAGFQGVVLLKGSGDIYSSKVVRATAGSIFRVPVLFIDTEEEAIVLLRANKKTIFCTGPKADQVYFDAKLAKNAAIVIGNEANGISDSFMRSCDSQISIPMSGTIESMNAAICAAILMYEAVRQNLKQK